MPLKQFKPTSPGRRNASGFTFEEITYGKPERTLLEPLRRSGGRNNRGRLTVRHRGGGAKRSYRRIDFKRDKTNVPARVQTIEYDPNRSANIALLFYADGEKRYILAPVGLTVGEELQSGPEVEIKVGNHLPLRNIPLGTVVHNIELYPGRGGQLARGAGSAARLMAKEGDYALIRLPSREVRRVRAECTATIGQVGNTDFGNRKLGKAGIRRRKGWRPSVRGSAMNPVDHPHGGGEGKAPIGMPGPKTPWGKPALGYKTRKSKPSDAMIVRGRRRR